MQSAPGPYHLRKEDRTASSTRPRSKYACIPSYSNILHAPFPASADKRRQIHISQKKAYISGRAVLAGYLIPLDENTAPAPISDNTYKNKEKEEMEIVKRINGEEAGIRVAAAVMSFMLATAPPQAFAKAASSSDPPKDFC